MSNHKKAPSQPAQELSKEQLDYSPTQRNGASTDQHSFPSGTRILESDTAFDPIHWREALVRMHCGKIQKYMKTPQNAATLGDLDQIRLSLLAMIEHGAEGL